MYNLKTNNEILNNHRVIVLLDSTVNSLWGKHSSLRVIIPCTVSSFEIWKEESTEIKHIYLEYIVQCLEYNENSKEMSTVINAKP